MRTVACSHCGKTNVRLTYRPDINGRPRYQRQCMDCGQSVGNFINKSDAGREAGPLGTFPLFDEQLSDKFSKAKAAERETKQEEERQKWWKWYTEYLKSDAWKHKAAAVHRRAKGICEGCGQAPSRQVHHLTYEHAGNEFLWELVAICDDCHERAHSKEDSQE